MKKTVVFLRTIKQSIHSHPEAIGLSGVYMSRSLSGVMGIFVDSCAVHFFMCRMRAWPAWQSGRWMPAAWFMANGNQVEFYGGARQLAI